MVLRRILLALTGLGILLAATASSSGAARKMTDYIDKPTKEWREGPVRYIITKWEDDEYKSLKTDEARARFIESFWQRRDETPETPGNEFRSRFWKRVRNANRLYGEEVAKQGWRTDMGKIHILRGPPDDITRNMVPQGNRGTVIWTYRNSGEAAVGPNVVIAFARDATGEFRLSTEPTKDADPRAGIPLPSQPPMGTNKLAKAQVLLAQQEAARLYNLTDPLIRAAGGPNTATQLSLVMELAKLQQPSRKWEIRESITTQELFGSVPMRARADFFRTTGTHTLVVLTVGVRSSAVHYRRVGNKDVPDVVFYARILDLTGNDLILGLERDEDFVPAAENASAGLEDELVYQARLLLDPGSYQAKLSVVDRAGGRAGSYQIPMTVPDFKQVGLTLSTIMLAQSISPAPESATEYTTPFVMGNLRVIPRLAHEFTGADALSFYYQVYGAGTDPQTGEPDLDVDYGFFTVDAEELQDLGHVEFPGQTRAVHGYTVQLKDWPSGPYLLRVSVNDRVSDTATTRDLVFEID